jgi:hypothetical protein
LIFQGLTAENDLKISVQERKLDQENENKIKEISENITEFIKNNDNNYRNKSFTNFNLKTEPIRNISPIVTNNTNKSFNGTCSGNFPKEFFSTFPKVKRKFDVKFIKAEKSKNPLWKELKIADIVKKERLDSENPNIMIFKSELMKYSFSTDPKLFINYCQRLCILTKSEFILFHSKESFLRLQKPTFKIDLKDIVEYGRIDPKKEKFKTKKEFFYFFLKFDDSKKEMIKIRDNTNADLEENKDSYTKSANKNLPNQIRNIKNHCIGPFKNTKINLISAQNKLHRNQDKSILNIENKRKEKEDNTHIFASTSEDLINKWIFLIDYFKFNCKM